MIRPIRTLDEYRACVELQEAVWGRGFSQRVPTAILQVSRRLGGVVSGAWNAEGVLMGFIFGITGWEAGRPVHWSDMLAVRPEHRDGGLGRRLKLHQRDELLRTGVTRMYWTFDPLESRNAYLNLARLGAVAREYVRDMYGISNSPLHRGIGTDRFVAVWEMDSPRVRHHLGEAKAGEESPKALSGVPEAVVVLDGIPRDNPRHRGEDGGVPMGLPEPGDVTLDRDEPILSVAIPASIQDVLGSDPDLAVRWRLRTRATLEHYMGRGWVPVGLHRDAEISRYILMRKP